MKSCWRSRWRWRRAEEATLTDFNGVDLIHFSGCTSFVFADDNLLLPALTVILGREKTATCNSMSAREEQHRRNAARDVEHRQEIDKIYNLRHILLQNTKFYNICTEADCVSTTFSFVFMT